MCCVLNTVVCECLECYESLTLVKRSVECEDYINIAFSCFSRECRGSSYDVTVCVLNILDLFALSVIFLNREVTCDCVLETYYEV